MNFCPSSIKEFIPDVLPPRVVDVYHLADFLCWIYSETQPRPNEGHVILSLIRSKGLKEKYGFKGSEHSLGLRWVPGYLSPFEKWFSRALNIVLTEAFRADYVVNVYWRYGKEPVIVPPELVTIMINPNPSNWVKSSHKACIEFYDDLIAMEGKGWEHVARVDARVTANMMKHLRKVFAQIDVDSKESDVVQWVLQRIPKGTLRAVIETPHGYHFLVRIDRLSAKEAKIMWREFGKDNIKKAFGNEKIVELKTNFQEPLPGLRYQGKVVRFIPVR